MTKNNAQTAKTDLATAIELVGPEVAAAYFKVCAEKGICPDPVELVGSYEGTVIEIDSDGLATVKHKFDI